MTLINADCLEVSLPKVNMVLTDLPYGKTANKRDKILDMERFWAKIEECCPDGNIVLFGQDKFTGILMQHKWHRYNLIWDKVLLSGFLNANRQPLRGHEDICVLYRKKTAYNPQKTPGAKTHSRGKMLKNTNNNYCYFERNEADMSGMKFPTSILKFPKPHPSKCLHPTEKPVKLLEYLIKTYSNEGNLILDCCMGSGSTGEACQNTNREFIGIERYEDTFNVAKKRLWKTY